MVRRSPPPAIAAAALLAGCASLNPFAEPDPRWADYKSWTKVTEGEPSTGASTALGGVHRGAEGYRDVYVNDVGLATITGEGPYDFPAGTVIVKEQFADEAAWRAGRGAQHTISLKVADTDGVTEDDWNWAAGYTGAVEQDIADPDCAACHTAAVALNRSDYVFSVPAYLAAN